MPRGGRERKERDLRRIPGKRPPRRVILVTCEGKKTECIYLKGLWTAWRISTAEIEVVGVGMTPSKVVEEAITRKQERHREARKGNAVDYDQVWCVFDCDEHGDIGRARQLAKNHDIHIAYSVPCFEICYLLHFKYTAPFVHNYDELERFLKKYIPGYEKNGDYTAKLLDKLDDALRNAGLLRTENAKIPTPCAATDVDPLVKVMRSLSTLSHIDEPPAPPPTSSGPATRAQ